MCSILRENLVPWNKRCSKCKLSELPSVNGEICCISAHRDKKEINNQMQARAV